ncbi:MAG TPA: cell division protein ZapA [Caulobacteraceae bacterium]|jgi:cell division protein ZapA
MAQVTIEVNGRPYPVGCEDGQEEHVRSLAALFDEQVRQVAGEVGQLAESRLFLMGALLLADELADLRDRLAVAQGEAARVQAERTRSEARAVEALDEAARQVEALAAKAGG